MNHILRVLWTSYLVQLARSEPKPSFPLNAQLPPVARVDQFFSYSFSPHTFQSNSNITYTLGNHPSWLSIDEDGGRLYGIPDRDDIPQGDVVGQQIDLIATDETGSASMNATLVVSRNQSPSVQIPITRQIESFGPFSAPSSLLSYPSTDFEYKFDTDTFSTPRTLNYYAISNDSSPLPAWIKFDANSLSFSGKTPAFESLIQPPQTFDISLVASDIVGFSATRLSFSIVVGRHKLTTEKPIIELNVTKGSELSYEDLENGIRLDNKQVTPGYLNVSVDGMPHWLTYDGKKGRFHGTPKDGDHSTNFTINFQDAFQDTLSVLVRINVSTGLFQSTFDDIEARPGEAFTYDLESYFRDPTDIQLKVDVTPHKEWLKVEGFKLYGKIPITEKGSFDVAVHASSISTGLKETEMLHVVFLAVDGSTISSTPSPSSTIFKPTSTGPAGIPSSGSHSAHVSTAKILLATLIPILFIALAIILLLCFRRHRRHRRSFISSKRCMKISRPIPSTLRVIGSGSAPHQHLEKMMGAKHPNMPLFKNGDVICADARSQTSVRPGSSETLGNLSLLEAPPAILASRARPGTIRSVNVNIPDGDGGRDSWVTVEDTATISRSKRSIRSHCSDMTLPDLAQTQHQPARSFMSETADETFESGIDVNMASLDDLTNIQQISVAVYKPTITRRSIGEQSTTTSSSAALPNSHSSNQRVLPKTLGKRPMRFSEGKNGNALVESEAAEGISELRRPDELRLSSQQWHTRRALSGHGKESSIDKQSFMTVSSFASSENWRVIGRHDTSTNLAGHDTLNEPPRPSSAGDGAGPRERQDPSRRSLELMSPSSWEGDETNSWPLRTSMSAGSGLGADSGSISGDREAAVKATVAALRDDPAKMSQGSFKMFI
ncbi:Axial budding pattern 2-like protein [Cladobotryum mycophilum]|uniref:Axial budding pattern 2-like protein n=1 Tax=Cladobotryum mycophilum TaxID=491253 RepID=A0ABR0SJL8_9HYPO